MSAIPTKHTDGDVSVGRNVSAGGDVNVQGRVRVGHNLVIEGWLEAPNIKAANKGVFRTPEELVEAYPNPGAGWWALVGDTLPAPLYLVENGRWKLQKNEDGSPKLAGNPTIDSSAYAQDVEDLRAGLEEIRQGVSTNSTEIDSLQKQQQSQGTEISSTTKVAKEAKEAAEAAQSGVDVLNGKIGRAGGLAVLDGKGRVPEGMIPPAVDDVVEFDGFFPALAPPVLDPAGAPGCDEVLFCASTGTFFCRYNLKLYAAWAGMDLFGEFGDDGVVPVSGKIYVDVTTNMPYRWTGTALKNLVPPLGESAGTAYPGAKGKQLRDDVDALNTAVTDLRVTARMLAAELEEHQRVSAKFINVNDLFDNDNPYGSLAEALPQFPEELRRTGTILTLWVETAGADGEPEHRWMTYRWARTEFDRDNDWEDASQWEEFGAGTADGGGLVNVTAELPKQDADNPYDDLASAIVRVFKGKRARVGLQIAFAASAKVWKLYAYVGATAEPEDFLQEANWIEFTGAGAGSVPFINVDDLCGAPADAEYHTFESATAALAKLEADTGTVCRKSGMVITYRVSSSEWETLQLVQKAADFGTRAAWTEFGGGSKVEAMDAPAAGGKDAFSTGGAYAALPARHEVTQDEGTVSIQIQNAAGEPIMEPITFLAGSGGGGGFSGTIVSVKFEQSPLFGALGSDIATRAAIRSVTMAGAEEVDNAIATLELIDRDTNVTVWSENVNRPSSASMDDYSFTIDFTPFLVQAGQKRFTLRATDEAGNTTTKYITVTAEDITVTVSSEVQVLHVRPDAMITPAAERASVDLFKFANNQSDKGIEAVVDILIDGEWRELHRSVVRDSFTKTVTFSPATLGLAHGAYPVRVYGTSLNSGVRGNTVYSALMVVDPEATTPLVAIRYDDRTNGTVRLYDTLTFEVAVYNPKGGNTIINTKASNALISQLLCDSTHTYVVSKQIQGFADGDLIKLYAQVVSATDMRDFRSYEVPVQVSGSVIDATLKEGALYSFDFSARSNSEADHSIVDGDFAMTLTGANYTTNGFTKYLGQNCLRIAENVTGSVNHMPFASQALEAAGMAWQCQFATNNIKDADAMLLECYDPDSGAGFYIKGNKAGIFCRNGNQALEERAFPCNRQVTLGIVAEPASIYVERSGVKYSALRMYIDGELVAHIGYTPGRGDLFSPKNITVDGTKGDLYLYYMLAYQSHYEWAQAFKNYLVKLVDTGAMIKEFNAEDVLVSQTAEGSTAMRPSAAALWDRGIPYVVLVADEATFEAFDGGTSTSDNFEMTVYYYDPKHPWRSFKATRCRVRRQGTTSAKRCKKNTRIYLSKASEIIPLFPGYTNQDAIITYALFLLKKIRVGENTMAIDLTSIKIDYSDAGGANDCGVCDMMNATYRALGQEYMTPAQRFFDGTQEVGDVRLTGLELNHSTANHPIAVFRSTSDTLQNVYFEAKGNWKEDKGEQTALGFMNTPGYTLGCINYQDGSFTEYYGLPGETLDQTEARFRADTTTDTTRLYLLSQYCGNRYRFMRFTDGEWQVMSGKMWQTGGKGTRTWQVSGHVLNPVTGFELLTYQELDWWRGVDSLETMMRTGSGKISSWVQKLIDKGQVTADTVPLWTYYFECMVDNDDLAIAYATGRKVPFELYRLLRFCDSIDPDTRPDTYADRAHRNFYKFLNVRSLMVYYAATDYNSLYDQQAKNMQPMFFLEDGASIENGVWYDSYGEADGCDVETLPAHMLPARMYFNKVYDADGANGKDNDGGCTGDPECDPAKPTDEESGYANPYAGWNSILWVVLRLIQAMTTDDAGEKTDLRTVVAAMRSAEAVVDGRNMKPFSPEGALYFFMEKRLMKWPKMVSSYDGIRKYVQYTATSDTIYFYALQGLGLTSLPDFIEKRWRIRDGYYQTGAFFSGYISARIACSPGAKIRFTAARTGYFGIGNDNTAAVSESVYLEAGQSYEFTQFSHQTGALLYIYQADRMSELDLSEISLGSSNGEVDFTVMALVMALLLGSATHSEVPTGYHAMTSAKLGNLPFLETLDVRRTGLTALDASGCPRLRHLDARDSAVQSFSVAETSPINDIAVPGTLTEVVLKGLPQLTYTGLDADSGLQVPSFSRVQKLRLESSPNLDARRMLTDVLDGQTGAEALASLRIGGMPLKGDASELQTVIAREVAGLDSDGIRVALPVVNADYQLTTLLDASEIERIESSFDGLTLCTVIDAFIEAIDQVNAATYGGVPEVDAVTLDNIGTHIRYYNGETAAEALARQAEADRDIHQLIQS